MDMNSNTASGKKLKATLVGVEAATFTYTYRVGAQLVSVRFAALDTSRYWTNEAHSPEVSAAIRQAQRDHALLSL